MARGRRPEPPRQRRLDLHDVSNFISYHNGSYGIEHGAHVNSYRYANAALSTGSEHRAPEIIDFVESQLSGTQFSMKDLLSGTRIRVQSGGSAFQLDASGTRSTISPFVTVKGGGQPGPTSPPGGPGPHQREQRPLQPITVETVGR